jgi:hypothetical protein
MSKVCTNCGEVNDDLVIKCVSCGALFSLSRTEPISLEKLEENLYPKLRNRFLFDLALAFSIFLGVGLVTVVITSVTLYHATMEYARTNLAQQVALQFTDERVQHTLASVASNEASSLVRAEVSPVIGQFRQDITNRVNQFQVFLNGMQGSLTNTENRISVAETQIASVSTQISDLTKLVTETERSTESRSEELLAQLSHSSEEINVLRAYLDAKQGNTAAYNALQGYTLSKGSEAAFKLANAASEELWTLEGQIRVGGIPRTYKYFDDNGVPRDSHPSAESIYRDLQTGNANDQISAANEIKGRGLKYFSEILVGIVKTNINWKVTALCVSALEQFSGRNFEVYHPYPSVTRWWDTEQAITNETYKSPFARIPGVLAAAANSTNGIEILLRFVNEHPGLCETRTAAAMICLSLNRRDDAEQQLKAVQKECGPDVLSGYRLAKLLVEDKKLDEASDLLKTLRHASHHKQFDDSLHMDPGFSALSNKLSEITKD